MTDFTPCNVCGSPFLCSRNKECHIGPPPIANAALAAAKQRIEQLENTLASYGIPLP